MNQCKSFLSCRIDPLPVHHLGLPDLLLPQLLPLLQHGHQDNVEPDLVQQVVPVSQQLVLVASGVEDDPDHQVLLEVDCDQHYLLPARDSDGNRSKFKC